MVGIVIVSHSQKLADGVLDITKLMAEKCPIATAGGKDNNKYGTSYKKIKNAIESVYSKDGVVVLVDMGSALMTAHAVIEDMDLENIILIDCPLVEGAIAASISSSCGDSIEKVKEDILAAKIDSTKEL